MKKSTKIGLALVGIAGIAVAASQITKKYLQDDFYDEDDYVDEDQDFLEDYDELSEEDFADNGEDEVIIEKTERIIKPALKTEAKESAKPKTVTKKTTKKVVKKAAKKPSSSAKKTTTQKPQTQNS